MDESAAMDIKCLDTLFAREIFDQVIKSFLPSFTDYEPSPKSPYTAVIRKAIDILMRDKSLFPQTYLPGMIFCPDGGIAPIEPMFWCIRTLINEARESSLKCIFDNHNEPEEFTKTAKAIVANYKRIHQVESSDQFYKDMENFAERYVRAVDKFREIVTAKEKNRGRITLQTIIERRNAEKKYWTLFKRRRLVNLKTLKKGNKLSWQDMLDIRLARTGQVPSYREVKWYHEFESHPVKVKGNQLVETSNHGTEQQGQKNTGNQKEMNVVPMNLQLEIALPMTNVSRLEAGKITEVKQNGMEVRSETERQSVERLHQETVGQQMTNAQLPKADKKWENKRRKYMQVESVNGRTECQGNAVKKAYVQSQTEQLFKTFHQTNSEQLKSVNQVTECQQIKNRYQIENMHPEYVKHWVSRITKARSCSRNEALVMMKHIHHKATQIATANETHINLNENNLSIFQLEFTNLLKNYVKHAEEKSVKEPVVEDKTRKRKANVDDKTDQMNQPNFKQINVNQEANRAKSLKKEMHQQLKEELKYWILRISNIRNCSHKEAYDTIKFMFREVTETVKENGQQNKGRIFPVFKHLLEIYVKQFEGKLISVLDVVNYRSHIDPNQKISFRPEDIHFDNLQSFDFVTENISNPPEICTVIFSPFVGIFYVSGKAVKVAARIVINENCYMIEFTLRYEEESHTLFIQCDNDFNFLLFLIGEVDKSFSLVSNKSRLASMADCFNKVDGYSGMRAEENALIKISFFNTKLLVEAIDRFDFKSEEI